MFVTLSFALAHLLFVMRGAGKLQNPPSGPVRFFDASNRVSIDGPQTAAVGETFSVRLTVCTGELMQVGVSEYWSAGQERTRRYGRRGDMMTVTRNPAGESYLSLVGTHVGPTSFEFQGFFRGGGHWHQTISVEVRPQNRPPAKFWINPAEIGLSLAMTRPLAIQPFTRYDGFTNPIWVDPSYVTFTLKNADAKEVATLDATKGSVQPKSVGHALLTSSYQGLRAFTCIIVVAETDELGGKEPTCDDLLDPDEVSSESRPPVH